MLESGSGLMAHTQKRAFRFTRFQPQFISFALCGGFSQTAANVVVADANYLSLPLQIMIGVQHFAHFYLTLLLLDKMKDSAPPPSGIRSPTRIVFTTSASEATGQQEIPWDNLG